MKYSPYTIIPASVIANIKEKYENFDGKGFTVVETSHRSNAYSKLNEETQSLLLQYF
jgi:phosphoserine aminotransferase